MATSILRRTGIVRFERAIVQGSMLVGLSIGGLLLWAATNEGSAVLAALAVISAAIGIASVFELLVARYFPVSHMVVIALVAALFPLDVNDHVSLGLGSAFIACAAFGILLIDALHLRWAFLTLIGLAGATHLLRWMLSGATTYTHAVILISQGAIFIAVTYAFDRFRTEMLLRSEVDRVKDEFLATVSHELRTPLTGVVGFAELGRGQASSPGSEREVRGYFDEILAEGYRMSHIVDSLIAAAGGASFRSESDLSHVHVRPLVEATLRDLGLDAVLMRASNDAGCVRADPQLVVVVLQHLVRNAIDHGGGELALSTSRRGNSVVVRVSDGGAVIPRKHRDAIFLPYTTVGAPREPRRLGLGLVIARRLARSMGGDVTYDFKDDDGPSFNLELVALTCHSDPHASEVAEQKLGRLNGEESRGFVLEVASPGTGSDRRRLEELGHVVMSCPGPAMNGGCRLIEKGSCPLYELADGIVFRLDLDSPTNREILHRYQNMLGTRKRILVIRPGDGRTNPFDGPEASVGEIASHVLDSFSRQTAVAVKARRSLTDLVRD